MNVEDMNASVIMVLIVGIGGKCLRGYTSDKFHPTEFYIYR